MTTYNVKLTVTVEVPDKDFEADSLEDAVSQAEDLASQLFNVECSVSDWLRYKAEVVSEQGGIEEATGRLYPEV